MPSTFSQVASGAAASSIGVTASPGSAAYSCTPKRPVTKEPSLTFSLRDSTTSPTPIARITSPSPTGGTYDGTSLSHPRIAGSSDSSGPYPSPAPPPASGPDSSTMSHVAGGGMPSGRFARRHWRFVAGTALLAADVPHEHLARTSPRVE